MKLIATVLAVCSVLAAQTPQTQTPVFRSGATLVPLDVRVLDRNGKPITDLRQDEFVVTEDKRPQTISQFSATALTPMAADDTPGRLRAVVHTDSLAPQTHRVFLLLMGRGRLQPPSKGVDAMMQFVRERVLPQDQVAVLAWNRATDFTTNHAGLAELLERFKVRHEKVETDLYGWFSGLRAAHTLISDPNQRTLTTDEMKKRADALQQAEINATRPAGCF